MTKPAAPVDPHRFDFVKSPPKRLRKIRDLTALERKCTAGYRGQLAVALARQQAAADEAARIRGVLADFAIVFAGREGPVEMTDDALFEPVEEEERDNGT